jgi:hypothetical protein
MSKIVDEVLAANASYVSTFGDKGKLAMPPARHFAILTCMDARLDPAKYAGLAEGDAHVIRNAGGRATDDAIRSLVISHKLLGTLVSFITRIAEWSSFRTASWPICLRMISEPPHSMARSGRIVITAVAMLTAISSNGIQSQIRRRACFRTYGVFASIRSYPRLSRSMAMSTMCIVVVWRRLRLRRKRAALPPEICLLRGVDDPGARPHNG